MCNLMTFFDLIIISSVSASVLIGIILLVKLIVKDRQSPRWHYCIWFILMIRLMIPYVPHSSVSIFNLISPLTNKISVESIESRIKTLENVNLSNETKGNNVIRKGLNPINKIEKTNKKFIAILKNYFMIIWLMGVTMFLLYTIIANFRLFIRVKNSSVKNTEGISSIVSECKSAIKINKDVSVILTTAVSSPSLLGFTKPIILFPQDILKTLNRKELNHIILHELSHYKTKDNIVSWMVIFVKALHWFNPIIWYGFYKMHEDCEIACDANAMSCINKEDTLEYGYTIIHLVNIISKRQTTLGTLGILSSKSGVKRRIIMISRFNADKHNKKNKFSVVGGLIILALSCILLTNAKSSIAYANKIVQSDVKSTIDVKDIKYENFDGKMMIISNSKKVSVGYALNNSKVYKTTSEIAKKENALAAINAGGFNADNLPCGFIIKDGELVYKQEDEVNRYNTVGIDKNGLLVIGKYTYSQLKNMQVKEAVGFGSEVIRNGKIAEVKNSNLGVGPRTAIGQMKDGKLVFLVINGRSDTSKGATVKQAADVLLNYGVVNAALLDGGNSSTMYYNGSVITYISNLNGERAIPSAFLVLS